MQARRGFHPRRDFRTVARQEGGFEQPGENSDSRIDTENVQDRRTEQPRLLLCAQRTTLAVAGPDDADVYLFDYSAYQGFTNRYQYAERFNGLLADPQYAAAT